MENFTTPPAKRRRLLAIRPSPPRLSDLLAAFGARKTPTSERKMDRGSAGRSLRVTDGKNYAESEASSFADSPQSSSSFNDAVETSRTSVSPEQQDESEDELQSDDVIHAVPRRVDTIQRPQRSTRKLVNYARHVKKTVPRRAGIRKSTRILTSDTVSNSEPLPKQKKTAETERSKIRHAIAEETKPKRDAFLLVNKDYFLPVLPESNYVNKLQRLHGADPEIVSYSSVKQPLGVRAVMKPYQLEGLSFLAYMHNNGMPSILGDEMGLGKTLQTLSLFQYLEENEPKENRPHLVVCPMSVLSSWINEARKWVPALNVIRFHGPKLEREKLKHDLLVTRKGVNATDRIDIVVTTYETFVAEKGWFKRAFAWRYVVLDEGHKIKNERSGMSSALQSIQAEHRLLLTGTPLQNNLKEMWALLHWLYPEIFGLETASTFTEAFDLANGKASTSFMDDARRLLELVMLRRMKSSPGVNLGLPPKEEILLYVPLTPMQRFWYTRLLTKADNAMLDELFRDAKSKTLQSLQHESDENQLALLEAGAAAADDAASGDAWAESKQIMQQALQNEQQPDVQSVDWRKLMNIIMQLRKVCSHPYVLKSAVPEPYYLGEHVKTASGKFIVLDKLIEELVVKREKKVLIFAGFNNTLNLCEDLLTLKGANTHQATFRFLGLDGSTARAKRNLGIRMFNDPKSDFKVMLIATRAGGLGINLASATNVIFMDEDWNPQVTLQAEARAHRIGQTEPVTVYKLCTQGTVEEQMMGRIRKKLYLSAKITESMRNIHGEESFNTKKRKRTSDDTMEDDDVPKLGTNQLKSLLRKGAQTLARPEVDVTAMLEWDFDTMIAECKDKADDPLVAGESAAGVSEEDEQKWLSSMERVETAVFEGKRLHKQLDKDMLDNPELDRAIRRVGKNTTVMIDGFAISKESLGCADWEAVPTLAGKDPRLAEPVREKKPEIIHQDYCQHCWDGGEVVLCSGCPRSYHLACLKQDFQRRAGSKFQFYCPQHQCVECDAKTADAGGLIFRCRWCENGYCEDCLDWGVAKLVGETLPEFEMLSFGASTQAWFIECPSCIKHWKTNKGAYKAIDQERANIEKQYGKFLQRSLA